jgi:ubiquinone/menaquinone biosynthesis C-methylase UbiE
MRLFILFFLTSVSCFAQDPWKNIYSAHAWDARDKWQRADELIKFLKISEGSQVADIGCNEGYLTFKLAKVVEDQGKVHAVDVDQSKLDKLKRYVDERKVKNVVVIKGDYDDPKLPENRLDAVIILDSYHEMDDHDEILQHIKVSLKPGGRLLLCEPIAEERRKLSRAEQEKKHELGMKFALEDLQKAGFRIALQKDPFIDRTKEKGDKMWVVVAEKPIY